MPTGGTDGTGSLGDRRQRAASGRLEIVTLFTALTLDIEFIFFNFLIQGGTSDLQNLTGSGLIPFRGVQDMLDVFFLHFS